MPVGGSASRPPPPRWPWWQSSDPVGRRPAARCGATQLAEPQRETFARCLPRQAAPPFTSVRPPESISHRRSHLRSNTARKRRLEPKWLEPRWLRSGDGGGGGFDVRLTEHDVVRVNVTVQQIRVVRGPTPHCTCVQGTTETPVITRQFVHVQAHDVQLHVVTKTGLVHPWICMRERWQEATSSPGLAAYCSTRPASLQAPQPLPRNERAHRCVHMPRTAHTVSLWLVWWWKW